MNEQDLDDLIYEVAVRESAPDEICIHLRISNREVRKYWLQTILDLAGPGASVDDVGPSEGRLVVVQIHEEEDY